MEPLYNYLINQWGNVKTLVKGSWVFCLVAVLLFMGFGAMWPSWVYSDALKHEEYKNRILSEKLEETKADLGEYLKKEEEGQGLPVCAIFDPICPSEKDKLTRETVAQVIFLNELQEDICKKDVALFCKSYEPILSKGRGDKVIKSDK